MTERSSNSFLFLFLCCAFLSGLAGATVYGYVRLYEKELGGFAFAGFVGALPCAGSVFYFRKNWRVLLPTAILVALIGSGLGWLWITESRPYLFKGVHPRAN